MNEKLFEEDLSISYLRAVAAQAQVTFELKKRDDDSVDAELRKLTETDEGKKFRVEFNVQLKATYCGYTETEDSIKYPLKVKNYNDLRMDSSSSIILCLLILPEEHANWIVQSSEELTLKKCMYWISLKNYPETTNTSTVTITIPKTNIISVESLQEMVHIVANGGEL